VADRDFDLVMFGATGFTGRLVAEHLAAQLAARSGPPRHWAVAGRNRDKLAALAIVDAGGAAVPILECDALDPDACAAIARRARVVCTTVGPYAKYGVALAAACAQAGTHYCDLTGEVTFMRASIDANHAIAQRTGARIVHACGFDSIPSDLGTWATQQAFVARYGHPAAIVTALFGETSGGMSGGTAASAFELAEAMREPAVRKLLRDPYALIPEPDAPRPPIDQPVLGWNRAVGMFTAPFFMAGTNAPVVRRGHALAGYPWGRDFVYRELMSTPGNARGALMAVGVTAALGGLAAAMKRPKLRAWLRTKAPQPGEGPSAAKRAAGYWRVRFVAEAHTDARDDAERLIYKIGDPAGDPGYASTAKMLGQSALCLAFDALTTAPGVTTPSAAMGGALLARLRAVGLEFGEA